MDLRAVSAPGLEALLAGELASLGLSSPARYLKPGARSAGGAFTADAAGLYRACLWLRTAERVLVRLGRFRAKTLEELSAGARALPWDDVLAPGTPVAVRARCRRSRLHHDADAAKAVAAASGRPEGESQPVLVTLEDDEATVELDAAGEPLHRRGYRQALAKAPLRETLAAALVLASGWDRATPFLDPFCGSGTIAVEAALLARRIAPGKSRRFAFMDWPSFDPALWKRQLEEAACGERADGPPIAGSDRDDGAVAAAKDNAERAGVAGSVAFSRAAVSAAQPPSGVGALVTNPPYGLRVTGRGDPRDVYAQLGKLVASRCAGWRVALLCPDEALARATGLSLVPGPSTKNGGLDVRFWVSR